jgi:GAF domain-containing protein/HAMP domain-containing protein/anti-sigma regulatory factor (Ser/Thr protein kinase)
MPRRLRLFPKYALLIITVVGGLLIVSGVIGVYFSWRETEANIVALQEEKAESAAARIHQYIVDIAQQISWAGLPPASTERDALEERKFEYTKLLKQVSAITEVAWIDPAGREQLRISRIAMNTIRGDVDMSREPKFRKASTGPIHYGQVYFRKDTEPYMTIARPAGGGGVIAAEVNLKFVWDVVSRIRIGEKGSAHVIDAQGSLIAHPDISLVLRNTDLSALPQVAALRNPDAKTPPVARGIAGDPVLSAHAAIPDLDWTVFVESPESEAFAPLYASILRAALLLGAGLLISMVASFFVARALVRPLQAMQEGAARIGAGELDRRIEVRTGDELEGLAEQFNQMAATLKESYSGLERKVAQRTAELSETLDRQTATAEILRVISESPADVQPVFDAIARSGVRLFKGAAVAVSRPEAGMVRSVAIAEDHPDRAARWRDVFPIPLDRAYIHGAAILDCRVVDIADVLQAGGEFEAGKRNLEPAGYRAITVVPMARDGVAIGAIAVVRVDPGALSQEQIALLQTFADQAVIAIENVRLFNETQEALAHQTATADILRVISESPTDVQPVFEAIARRSVELCNAMIGTVTRFDGRLIHIAAFHGATAEQMATINAAYPLPPGKDTVITRAVRDRAPALIPNVFEDADYASRAGAEQAGYRSLLGVPMLREGQVIGAIGVARAEVGPFPEKHVKLLKTFADQAVIAIENVRLFNETKEALDRQTATAEVLRVISSSVADAQPVFEKITQSCGRLFAGTHAAINLVGADGLIHLAAYEGPGREKFAAVFPFAPNRESGTTLAMTERRVMHYPNVEDPDVPSGVRRGTLATGVKSVLFAPLLLDDRGIGAIAVAREAAGAFLPNEISLLKTFADQAVIAIENARLFNETQEALERQTATAEVLRVISSSVADSSPVFEKILESCDRLFASNEQGILLIGENGRVDLAAHHGHVRDRLKGMFPSAHTDGFQALLLERGTLHIRDVLADPGVPPGIRAIAEQLAIGSYSQVFAPMLWKGRAIGTLYVTRQPPTGFSDKEVELLRTFADQAVIAIQNARLFNETREALEQQTATAEILQVISRSVADSQPVFEAILRSCERLFNGAHMGITLLGDDGRIHLRAHHGPVERLQEFDRSFPVPLSRESGSGSVILDREVQAYEDVDEPGVPATVKRSAGAAGTRSVIFAPLLWEGRGIGAIFVGRKATGAFSAKDVALIRTFADQAVIAIQNARLFNETKEALEQQTATAEVLQVISSSVADTEPVFDKILDSCERLFAATGLGIYLIDDDGQLQRGGFRARYEDSVPIVRSVAGEFPRPLEGSVTEIAIRERRVVHFADVLADADAPVPLKRIAGVAGSFSVAFAPMLWEGRGVGAIQVSRDPPQAFSDKELALLKTFADQAVIAIQNARLFNELEAKGRELEQANRHKSEFLANMSHELRTPLNAIIGFSEVLSEKMFGDVNDKQLEYLLDIHSSGQHLLSLINDILDLSKIEAGRMELDLATTSLPMLLDNCTTLVRERASRQGLTLALDVEPDVGDWVADVRKLKQVVINLLSNAVKFTPAGGRVTLRARRLEHAVEIAVVDTGVGIAPDQQALVFEEFRQAGGDYLRKSEGTGLGLSLAKRFVELHGGTIRVESAPGRGSTFAFILPERVLEAV